MDIIEVSSQEYDSVMSNFTIIYNSPAFNELNRYKVEEVKYLLFVRKKVRIGLIGGIHKEFFASPFSAPFSGFSTQRKEIGLEYIQEAAEALKNYARKLKLKGVLITLPPQFYDDLLIAKTINSLHVTGFKISDIDLNYHFDLSLFDARYSEKVWRNARKNLRIALQQGMTFRECTNETDQRTVYNIISANRQAKERPLRMTYEQIAATSLIVGSYFFLVEFDNEPVAAAIVFKVANGIVQVIYWGDLPDKSSLKPVNFLSYNIFMFFKKREIGVVDIGLSTENSRPNFGLCKFKESIGCQITPKLSFEKKL